MLGGTLSQAATVPNDRGRWRGGKTRGALPGPRLRSPATPRPVSATICVMALMQLPRTVGCLVCGRDNPVGLRLTLSVDDSTGEVSAPYTAREEHIGFRDTLHGGMIATVLDETMAWAAIWQAKRFCLCGELTTRFRKPAVPGRDLLVRARVTLARPRMIVAGGELIDEGGEVLASATAKYVPLSPEQHARIAELYVQEPASAAAVAILQRAAPAGDQPPAKPG